MTLFYKYQLLCTTGPRDSPYRVGSGSGTRPLDFVSRDPVPDPETLPTRKWTPPLEGLVKQRKERSFCERKFCLRKEGFDIHLVVNTSSNS